MIDWTDEFEILSLMGVEKGWDAVYITYFCDMGYHAWRDSAHATRSCRTRNQRVPQVLESLPLLYVSNPRIEIVLDNESSLQRTHHIDVSPILEESLGKKSTS